MSSSKLRVHLTLGRISNLPTVWSNVLAGATLANASRPAAAVIAVAVAMSIYYTGGMYLNDAFDRKHDLLERADRPIPAGRISARAVFALGFTQLALATALLTALALGGATTYAGILGGMLLASAVVLYDVWHKGNPLGPLLMGLCRALVYIAAALALAGRLTASLWIGVAVLFAYLNLLTYVAKQRGVSGRVVARFIAGISLLDALLIASAGDVRLALIAALGFPLTLLGQRYVSGT